MNMKATYPLLLVTAMAASAIAQELVEPTDNAAISDTIQKAIDEFNRSKKVEKSNDNEVIVVLDPPAPPMAPEKEEMSKIPEAPAVTGQAEVDPKESKPLLVTGKPPEEAKPEAQAEESQAVAPEAVAEAEVEAQDPEAPPKAELEVRVESIRKGSGTIDPSQVKLKASFPAKPLSEAPEGWILEKSEQAPVFRKDVELRPGTTISLSIKPHILNPDADGINTFSVGEPGFEASQGYLQENTVSAILSSSVAQLDNDSLQLGNAISELHRLLGSLPKIEEPQKP
ncbi:MAG: hypothetical protein RLZZ505_75 [Verrucomicrobiota bacterium]|jgi:hypothetical protein